MTVDEGYIKYSSDWTPGPPPDSSATELLNRWRRRLYAARLIGFYDDLKIGYGNISIRCHDPGQFVISGSQTGFHAETDGRHYALVTECDIGANRVSSTGPVQASSEALTHAALYELSDDINAVVHVHSTSLWTKLKHRIPTTSKSVAYGTSEMAHEFQRLYRETEFPDFRIAVMAGHEDGLICIGETLEESAQRVLRLVEQPR